MPTTQTYTETQLDVTFVKNLVASRYPPLRLTGLLLLWLQQHFNAPGNIVESGLNSRIWASDDTTNLLILQLPDWKPHLTEKRPALIIKRMPIKQVKLGIDNRHMGYGMDVSLQRYTVNFQGSFTVFCIGNEYGEVEQLASEVAHELLGFASVIRMILGWSRIELVGIGEVSKLEESKEHFIVPVDLAYCYPYSWYVIPVNNPYIVNLQSLLNGKDS